MQVSITLMSIKMSNETYAYIVESRQKVRLKSNGQWELVEDDINDWIHKNITHLVIGIISSLIAAFIIFHVFRSH